MPRVFFAFAHVCHMGVLFKLLLLLLLAAVTYNQVQPLQIH